MHIIKIIFIYTEHDMVIPTCQKGGIMKVNTFRGAWIVGVLASFGLLNTVEASEQMIRFWRGHKHTALSEETFIDGLNQKFIPMTSNLGTTRTSMVGYLPVVPTISTVSDAPDEFALVVYADGETYKTFRATQAGQSYSAAHWDYFDKTNSKSTVAQAFVNQVELGKAYYLTPYNGRWDSAYARFTMIERGSGLTDQAYSKNVARWLASVNNEGADGEGRGHIGRIVLVENNYIATYDLWTDKDSFLTRNDNNMDSPDDFEEYYVGMYGVGRIVQDLELPFGLRSIGRGAGLNAPLSK
jgi:hypothetical protein